MSNQYNREQLNLAVGLSLVAGSFVGYFFANSVDQSEIDSAAKMFAANPTTMNKSFKAASSEMVGFQLAGMQCVIKVPGRDSNNLVYKTQRYPVKCEF